MRKRDNRASSAAPVVPCHTRIRMAEDMSVRHSDLALVVARIDVDGAPHWLLRRHPKWGDWSLVGGHVEPDEVLDWMLTAVRESNEEMAPLRCGVDIEVEPLLDDITSWGPVASRSAHGAMTNYRVRWFQVRFLRDVAECLGRLPHADFALVPETELSSNSLVSSVAQRLLEETHRRTTTLPLAGHFEARAVPLRIAAPS